MRTLGVGIAFDIAIDGHSDIEANSDPDTDSDPGISRRQLYYRDRN